MVGSEGAGGADISIGVVAPFGDVVRDSYSLYECLVSAHRVEMLTLAFQLSENSMMSRNSLTRSISRRDEVQSSSPNR